MPTLDPEARCAFCDEPFRPDSTLLSLSIAKLHGPGVPPTQTFVTFTSSACLIAWMLDNDIIPRSGMLAIPRGPAVPRRRDERRPAMVRVDPLTGRCPHGQRPEECSTCLPTAPPPRARRGDVDAIDAMLDEQLAEIGLDPFSRQKRNRD